MFKKIILTFVLLVFAQQEFYATQLLSEEDIAQINDMQKEDFFWTTINNFVNCDHDNGPNFGGPDSCPPKLWRLWAITDNVPIQYGNSKIWKHGEAYYGLSNGIGFFPSILNFGWLKIGIIDAHINVINLILDYFKRFVAYKAGLGTKKTYQLLLEPLFDDLLCGIHIVSIKILNSSVKIKFLTPIRYLLNGKRKKGDKKSTSWYIRFDMQCKTSWWYRLWSPRVEINISEIINYFKKK